MAQHGPLVVLRITCYSRRSYAALTVQRYERFFGNTLKVRALSRRITEASIIARTKQKDTASYAEGLSCKH